MTGRGGCGAACATAVRSATSSGRMVTFRRRRQDLAGILRQNPVKGGLVLIGIAGLAVGFAFMYASLHHGREAAVPAVAPVGRPAIPSPRPAEGIVVATAAPRAPDEARSAQLFDRNRGMPADPDLASEYEQINLDYFRNILPARTSVRWESGLADLGPLIADNFSVL